MHITVAYDFIYYRASREADMTSASYSKCLHNTGVLARRHSWWWCWHEVYHKWYSTTMWVVIEVGSGPREILSGRIFVRAPNKMGRIFADIMRPSVLPTVVFEYAVHVAVTRGRMSYVRRPTTARRGLNLRSSSDLRSIEKSCKILISMMCSLWWLMARDSNDIIIS